MTAELAPLPPELVAAVSPRFKRERTIHTCVGRGSGPTELAAFDGALRSAGIANFNLLVLSSVIPPGSRIATERDTLEPGVFAGGWGDRLYVVMAEQRVSTAGDEAWAGIGWVQDEESGKGLFVEHHGHGEDSVRIDIESSLDALVRGRGLEHELGPPRMRLQGAVCEAEPVCALVAAVFKSDPW